MQERRLAGSALLTGEERLNNILRKTSSTTPSYFSECFDTRLETWADPTPRESEFTVHNLREACIKACRRGTILQAARSLVRPSEEQLRQREEQDRKFAMIALGVYTKKYNMQPSELEFLEVKERNLIDESGAGYLHYNFSVKELDGKHTMFFAEVHHDLEDEDEVYLCMPLEEDDFNPSKENDQALCKACQHEAKGLIHPSCGTFLGGHKRICPRVQWDSIDDETDYEFV
ncbi:uncharacterized protein [Lolium perenne]|uniref:uncharacterized protein n=1 Tax=Lolium perenne TaxID=4522 RepID=UPI0021F5CCB6|nr:uncharacterized protein LOC127316512 [Lolium perenne]